MDALRNLGSSVLFRFLRHPGKVQITKQVIAVSLVCYVVNDKGRFIRCILCWYDIDRRGRRLANHPVLFPIYLNLSASPVLLLFLSLLRKREGGKEGGAQFFFFLLGSDL